MYAYLLQGNDPESQAWAAFDASRRVQVRPSGRALRNPITSTAAPTGTRAGTHSPELIAPASPVLQRYIPEQGCACASATNSVNTPGGAVLLTQCHQCQILSHILAVLMLSKLESVV